MLFRSNTDNISHHLLYFSENPINGVCWQFVVESSDLEFRVLSNLELTLFYPRHNKKNTNNSTMNEGKVLEV